MCGKANLVVDAASSIERHGKSEDSGILHDLNRTRVNQNAVADHAGYEA